MEDENGSEPVSRRGFMRAAAGGAAVAGMSSAATAQEEGGGGGGSTKEVIVGPGGDLVFEPAELTIAPGTTVNFVWESDNHNVVPSSQPDGAGWEGTSGGESKTYDTGHEYSYTFETLGTFEYFCAPHETAGMVGTITVQEGGASSGGSKPSIPDSAKTIGIASTGALVSTLGLAYFFMKYGGDYPDTE